MFALRPAKALKIFPLCLSVFHSPCIASSQFSKGCNEKGLLKFLVLFCIDMEFSLSRWQGTRVDILPFTWQDSSNPWGFGPINRRSNIWNEITNSTHLPWVTNLEFDAKDKCPTLSDNYSWFWHTASFPIVFNLTCNMCMKAPSARFRGSMCTNCNCKRKGQKSFLRGQRFEP